MTIKDELSLVLERQTPLMPFRLVIARFWNNPVQVWRIWRAGAKVVRIRKQRLSVLTQIYDGYVTDYGYSPTQARDTVLALAAGAPIDQGVR